MIDTSTLEYPWICHSNKQTRAELNSSTNNFYHSSNFSKRFWPNQQMVLSEKVWEERDEEKEEEMRWAEQIFPHDLVFSFNWQLKRLQSGSETWWFNSLDLCYTSIIRGYKRMTDLIIRFVGRSFKYSQPAVNECVKVFGASNQVFSIPITSREAHDRSPLRHAAAASPNFSMGSQMNHISPRTLKSPIDRQKIKKSFPQARPFLRKSLSHACGRRDANR